MSKTNFDYLKNIDIDLYEIITDAEKLYRGEFFEQCMGQTRRFGEHICRNVLANNRTTEVTFDEMLATLKDKINGYEEEKEFIEDLYFLKKCGNSSVHSQKVEHNATMALECLQRAFEIGISYSVYSKNAAKDNLKLQYDVELLITGVQSKKTLAEKYLSAKDEAMNNNSEPDKKNSAKKKKSPQVTSMKSVPKRAKLTKFWIMVLVFLFIALCAAIYILI